MYNFYPITLLNLFTSSTLEHDLKVVPDFEGDEEGREPTFQEIMQGRFNAVAKEIEAELDTGVKVHLKLRGDGLYLFMDDEEGIQDAPTVEGYQILILVWSQIQSLKNSASNIAQWKKLGLYKIVYETNNISSDNIECQLDF